MTLGAQTRPGGPRTTCNGARAVVAAVPRDVFRCDVTPRGLVHPGYAGGHIEAPELQLHMRLEEETATYIGAELRRHYEAGRSIREIAEDTHYPISRVRSLLQIADTPIRPRGKTPAAGRESAGESEGDCAAWD